MTYPEVEKVRRTTKQLRRKLVFLKGRRGEDSEEAEEKEGKKERKEGRRKGM